MSGGGSWRRAAESVFERCGRENTELESGWQQVGRRIISISALEKREY